MLFLTIISILQKLFFDKYSIFVKVSLCDLTFEVQVNSLLPVNSCGNVRFSIRGVKSLGSHFACLCRGFDFYEVKKKCIFQKEDGNTLTLLIIILVKSIQKEQIAQITQYDP